jgi:hypothetical protein
MRSRKKIKQKLVILHLTNDKIKNYENNDV